MAKDKRIFIDGVGETRMQDGAIRMDLLAMSPTLRNEDGVPTTEFVQQLVMTPVGFIRMVKTMRNTMKAMQDKGYFTQDIDGHRDEVDPGVATTADLAVKPADPDVQDRPKRKVLSGSPNF
ncbi:hypothetical protein EOI86_20000 [Hwanghaeella grinnelliae]|uniref:Uncharacterized protein n=1 Tax=Hwanghaeella grinnelliae TaxID=2500179 RepID=A0A3S2VNI0_9PROT|nr:hypothetical protein [Hwanghaeella grinnelliae]RVU35107.1 hypothetical protein EOI86_20000 [Hwanghaeella grinnelliae]